MLIGYTRISTDGPSQTTDLQRDALIKAGVDPRHLFEDHVSGMRDDRSALKAALDYVQSGDVCALSTAHRAQLDMYVNMTYMSR